MIELELITLCSSVSGRETGSWKHVHVTGIGHQVVVSFTMPRKHSWCGWMKKINFASFQCNQELILVVCLNDSAEQPITLSLSRSFLMMSILVTLLHVLPILVQHSEHLFILSCLNCQHGKMSSKPLLTSITFRFEEYMESIPNPLVVFMTSQTNDGWEDQKFSSCKICTMESKPWSHERRSYKRTS